MLLIRKLSFVLVAMVVAWQVHAAAPAVYGDWVTGTGADNTFLFASSVNDSGDTFGEYCYFKLKKCMWYLMLRTPCHSGDRTPVVAKSDASSSPLVVVCIGQMPSGERYSDGFEDWKSLESSITDSVHVGFTIPVASNKTTEVRFSLNGRDRSQQAMESSFFARISPPEASEPGGERGASGQTL